VVFVHQGLVEEDGAPEEVFGNSKSERFRKFISHENAA
jgi:octopine/nopaline transport system ATP-binding protein